MKQLSRRQLLAAAGSSFVSPIISRPVFGADAAPEATAGMRKVLTSLPEPHLPFLADIAGPDSGAAAPFNGTVSYADFGPGDGPIILYFGAFGTDHRQMLPLEWTLARDGYRVICVNRPGYAGTSLRARFADARSTARLADHVLQLSFGAKPDWSVCVIGTSGGAPSALAFASQFPNRARALTLQGGVSHPWTGGDGRPEPGGERFVSSMFLPAYRQAFGGEPGQGLLPMLRFGLLAAGGILAAGSSGRTAAFAGDQWRAAEVADPGRFRFVLNLALGLPLPAASCSPLPAILHAASSLFSDIAKVPGAVNDFRQILFAKQPFCDWPKIACPVLILHNPDDPLVPFAHAEFAFAALTAVPASQKELVKLDVAGHLMWVGRQADEMAARRAEFLRRHSQN